MVENFVMKARYILLAPQAHLWLSKFGGDISIMFGIICIPWLESSNHLFEKKSHLCNVKPGIGSFASTFYFRRNMGVPRKWANRQGCALVVIKNDLINWKTAINESTFSVTWRQKSRKVRSVMCSSHVFTNSETTNLRSFSRNFFCFCSSSTR